MKVTNIVRVFLVALSVIVLASCSGVVQEQYVQSLSDRTLCERWSGTGPGLRLFEEIEREKSQRKLNCSNLGFSVSKDAIRQSNEAQTLKDRGLKDLEQFFKALAAHFRIHHPHQLLAIPPRAYGC